MSHREGLNSKYLEFTFYILMIGGGQKQNKTKQNKTNNEMLMISYRKHLCFLCTYDLLQFNRRFRILFAHAYGLLTLKSDKSIPVFEKLVYVTLLYK